jgi:RecG-like helicase
MYVYLSKQAAEQGQQSYIVCPLIEESENIDCPSVSALFSE